MRPTSCCAPSLSGESFGMVLTEAFAAGTPVIASAIAGYSDVVDPRRRRGAGSPRRSAAPGRGAAACAPRAGAACRDGRSRTAERPALCMAPRRRPCHAGLRARDRGTRSGHGGRARGSLGRLASRRRRAFASAPAPAFAGPAAGEGGGAPSPGGAAGRPRCGGRARRRPDSARRAGGSASTTWSTSIVRSDMTWVLIACALMALSLFFRAASWYWIVRAALPQPAGAPPRRDLGDDDRRPDVGDASGAARGAGPCDGARRGAWEGCAKRSPSSSARWYLRPSSTSSRWPCSGTIIVSTTDLFHSSTQKLFVFSIAATASCWCSSWSAPVFMRRNGNGRLARLGVGPAQGAGAGARRPDGVPRSAPGRRWPPAPQLGVGDPAGGLLGAADGARAEWPGRNRRRGGCSLRRQRDRGRAGDPVEHRGLPARGDQRAAHRLRDRHR